MDYDHLSHIYGRGDMHLWDIAVSHAPTHSALTKFRTTMGIDNRQDALGRSERITALLDGGNAHRVRLLAIQ